MLIPVDHPVHTWLLRHVTFLQNVLLRGDDGHTPWARIKGRPFHQKLYGFGECVWWKRPTKGPQHQPDGKHGNGQ